MAEIGFISARITADDSDFQRAFRRSRGSIRELSDRFKTAAKAAGVLTVAVGGVAAALGTRMVNAQRKAIQSTQRLVNISGMQTRTIEAMRIQARDYGISQERVNDALVDFSERLGEAREGTGEALDGFKQLEKASGQNIDLGQNVNAVWGDFVTAMGRVSDESTRAAIAAQAGGDALRDMLPVLSQGKDGFEEAANEAERLGLAFTEFEGEQVRKANEAIEDMRTAFTGIGRIVTIELAKPMKAFADSITESLTGSKDFRENIRKMANQAIAGIASVLDASASVVDFVGRNSSMAKFGLIGFVLFGKRGALVGALAGKLFKGVERAMASMGITANETQAKFFNLQGALKKAEEKLDSLEKKNDKYAGQMKARLQPALEQQREKVAELRGELSDVEDEMGSDEFDEFVKMFEKGTENSNALAGALRSVADQIREAQQAANDATFSGVAAAVPMGRGRGGGGGDGGADEEEKKRMEERLQRIREHLMTEQKIRNERHQIRIEQLKKFRENELLTKKEYDKLERQLEAKHQEDMLKQRQRGMKASTALIDTQYGHQTGTMLQEFRTQIGAISQHNKKAFQIQKAFAISDAIVNAYQGITRTLAAYPYPFNLGMAAAHAAVAFAKVNAIRSQSFGGGGAGSTALPGSSAAQQPARQGAGSDSQGGSGPTREATFNIHGDNFGPGAIEQIADGLNEFMGDNGDLKVNIRRAT